MRELKINIKDINENKNGEINFSPIISSLHWTSKNDSSWSFRLLWSIR